MEVKHALPIRFGEFVALAAAMMSIQAIAVDAMLPALPAISRTLAIHNPNHSQWLVTAYVVGVALGQIVWGALSDRFGRRPILLTGVGLYVVAAALCGLSATFGALLAWRLIHG